MVAVSARTDAATPSPAPAAALPRVVSVEGAASGPSSQSQRKQPAFRLKPYQVQRREAERAEMRAAFDRIYILATEQWQLDVTTGAAGKGDNCAAAVAERFSEMLPEGCPHKLTGRSLINAVSFGRVGQPKGKPGPKAHIPDAFVATVAEFAQLQQVAGDDQKPRQLVQAAVAAAIGTSFETLVSTQSQRAALLRRVRREHGLAVESSTVIDDRRWAWLTSSNLTTWFRAYIKTLFDWGFIPSIPEDIFEEICIAAERAARMGNGDESHQKLSNAGDSSGPRSHVYINSALGRQGKRKYEYQKHATILVWLNYAGEVGAPHFMLATDAQAAKKNAPADADTSAVRARPEWFFGLPRVYGRFGMSSKTILEPSCIMNEKGGMASGGLEQFYEHQWLKAYPNTTKDWLLDDDGNVKSGPTFMQLDAGPDRYTECSLQWRAKQWETGHVLFPGLPNGTAANQVCDELFGPYKTACQEQIDDIISEQIAARSLDPSLKVGLDFCQLGRIINGNHGDPVEKRPFAKAFTPSKILTAVAKLGLSPINLRKALDHPRVRDDSAEGSRIDARTSLAARNEASLSAISALGFNPAPLTVVAPTASQAPAQFIAPPSDAETQWKAVKAAGGCAGAH